MSLILTKCIEFHEKRKICVASENGKVYTLNNLSNYKIKKVRIDNCLAQGNGDKRCDFLMSIDEKGITKRVYFIELKGSDLNTAIKQIYETIIYLKNEFNGYQVDVRIVGSRDVPGFINTPNFKKLAKEIKPSNGKIVRATNKIYTESI